MSVRLLARVFLDKATDLRSITDDFKYLPISTRVIAD